MNVKSNSYLRCIPSIIFTPVNVQNSFNDQQGHTEHGGYGDHPAHGLPPRGIHVVFIRDSGVLDQAEQQDTLESGKQDNNIFC